MNNSDKNTGKRKATPGIMEPTRHPRRGPDESPNESPVEMVLCMECGRNIPRTNMELHRITAHRITAHRITAHRNAAVASTPERRNTQRSTVDLQGTSISGVAFTGSNGSESSPIGGTGLDVASGTEPATRESEPTSRGATNATEPNEAATLQTPGSSETMSGEGDQWPCPRCTLLNSPTAYQCDACLFIRPNVARRSPLDESAAVTYHRMRPEDLRDDPYRMEIRQIDPRTVNTANSIVSGAFIGGVFGGPLGAVVGAAGGAVVDGISRFRNRRSSGSEGGAGGRSQPTPTVTVVTQRYPSSGFVVSSTNRASLPNRRGGTRSFVVRSDASGPIAMNDIDQAIMQMLMMSAMAQGHGDADHLTYEELLRRFGVGTENRGASQEDVDALPLEDIDNADELKDNDKTCNICLEDFARGDSVRKLSCSHIYHKNCIDRWLLQVSSCPVCKRDINVGQPGEANERQET